MLTIITLIAFLLFQPTLQHGPCGKQLHKGVIGYLQPENSQMQPGANCVWEIKPVECQNEIFLTFELFELDVTDKVYIKNGTGDSATVLFGPLNGTQNTLSFLTGSKDVTVTVDISKSSSITRRFRAYYNSQNCKKDLQSTSGNIQSPLFSNGHNPVNCQWRFNQSDFLSLTFKSFDLNNSVLHISGTANGNGDYKGNNPPPDIFANRYALLSLDLNSAEDRVEILYSPASEECCNYVKMSDGKPFSLKLPHELYQTYHCKWIFEAPSNNIISIKFENLKLSETDVIFINDGKTELSSNLAILTSYNATFPTSLSSTQNFMWIYFETDNLQPETQVVANLTTASKEFTIVNDPICGEVWFNKSQGMFGPKDGVVIPGLNCTWHIASPVTQLIFLKLDNISLGSSDIFTIRDGKDSRKVIFGPFHGNNFPSSIVTNSSGLSISLISDKLTNATETLHFHLFYALNSCGFIISNDSGLISSPLYDQSFEQKIICFWIFIQPMMQISIPSLNLTKSWGKIDTTLGPMRFSGTQVTTDYLLAPTSQLHLYLDPKEQSETLNFLYFTISPSCSSMIELDSKKPSFIFNLMDMVPSYRKYTCTLIIFSPNATVISVQTIAAELGQTDILLLKDGATSDSPILAIATSQNNKSLSNPNLTSHQNNLSLMFLTQTLGPSTNINIKFSYSTQEKANPKLCGKHQHSGLTGSLVPINNKISKSSDCSWLISPHSNNSIFIRFDIIRLQPLDTLKIINGSNPQNMILFGPFTGVISPFTVWTGSNVIQVAVVTTDPSTVPRDFRATYTVLGCTTDLQDEEGLISSPVYKVDNETLSCTWRFNQSDMQKVVFEEAQLSLSSQLNWNSQVIPTNNTPIEDRFSHSKDMLTLTLDTSVANQIMRASYTRVTPECSSSHTLFDIAPTFDISIPALVFQGISCNWIFKSPENSRIGLTFEALTVWPQDLVAINDGPSENASLIQYITSQNSQNITQAVFRTSGNAISIRFHSLFLKPQSTLKAKVYLDHHGGFFKDNGTVSIFNNSLYLIEEDNTLQVSLSLNGTLPAQGCLSIYPDFTLASELIRNICSNTSDNFPLVSPTNKMLVVPQFHLASDFIEASYRGIPKGCFTTSTGSSGTYMLSEPLDQACSWVISIEGNNASSSFIELQFLVSSLQAKLYTLKGEQLITQLQENMPVLYIPASMGVSVLVPQQPESSPGQALKGFYTLTSGCSQVLEGVLLDKQVFSPNYPNPYPLLCNCRFKIATKSPVYITLLNLVLAPGHSLDVTSGGKPVATYTEGSDISSDLVIASPASLEFKSGICNPTSCHLPTLRTAAGFMLNITSLTCGGLLTQPTGTISPPASIQPPFKCIWIIRVPNDMISFTLSWDKSFPEGLTIYNGPSLKSPALNNHTENAAFLSKTNSMVVVLEASANNSKQSFVFSYRHQHCLNITRCVNGFCMHNDWVCNGVNDCGDWSDERNCNTSWPTLPPPISTTGYVVGLSVGIPLALLLGLVLSVLLPMMVEKWRNRRDDFRLIINDDP